MRGGSLPTWRNLVRLYRGKDIAAEYRLTDGEAYVLTTMDDMIADEAATGRPGELWASNAYIAALAGVTERTVQRAVSKAVHHGLLVLKRRQTGMSRWRALPCGELEAKTRVRDFRAACLAAANDTPAASRRRARVAAEPPMPTEPPVDEWADDVPPDTASEDAEVVQLTPYELGRERRREAQVLLQELCTNPRVPQQHDRDTFRSFGATEKFWPLRNVMADRLADGVAPADVQEEALDTMVEACQARKAAKLSNTIEEIALAAAELMVSRTRAVRMALVGGMS